MKKLKYIVFVFIFFVLGIITANILNKDNVKEVYMLNSRYENISIYTSYNCDQQNVNSYLEDITKIPKNLLNNCDNIYFTDEDLTEKFNLTIKTKVVAISYGNDIFVNTDYYSEDILIHEMYHIYDYSNNWISETEDFLLLYEKYKDVYKVSPGNNENAYEFFATCGEYFTLKNLPQQDLYNFYKSLNILP